MAYQLKWSDTFEIDGMPDSKKWRLETGGNGFGNNEDQYYTDKLENAYVKDKRLVIEARKEIFENRNYTSAKLVTNGLMSMQYGKLLVSAKIPDGKGTWPAIRMLPDTFKDYLEWPDCGEIDLMENVGKNKDSIQFNLHTGIFNHLDQTQYTHVETIEGATEGFVEYGIIWTEDFIEFLVDDRRVAIFHKWAQGKTGDFEGWPFDQPFHLILNLAIGGDWGGEIDDSIFPAKFEIDYVKYYEWV